MKLVAEYGILLAIAAVFIWDKVIASKNMSTVLGELKASVKVQNGILEGMKSTAENTTTALNIIQNTMANTNQLLERHDKRSEYMNNDMREVTTLIKNRPCLMGCNDPKGR